MLMKRYFILANVLFITAAVFFSVKAFYKIATANIDRVNPSRVTARHVVPRDTNTRKSMSFYKEIIERNLFKTKTGVGRPSEKLDIETLKPTDLNLKLLGTVTGDDKKAYAVIEDASVKRQNLYKIGDIIQKATLKMILREKVVLHVNGKDEILEIEKVGASAQGRQKISRPSTRSADVTSQNVTLKRSQIETAVKDVNNLIKQVRIQPHFTNGKPDGLRLTGIRPKSLFYNMGLKSGDVIVGVDGNRIESVDDAIKFYQSLQSASKVQLQLKRRGRTKTIDYRIE